MQTKERRNEGVIKKGVYSSLKCLKAHEQWYNASVHMSMKDVEIVVN